jgi:hypothetical protein
MKRLKAITNSFSGKTAPDMSAPNAYLRISKILFQEIGGEYALPNHLLIYRQKPLINKDLLA